MGVDAMREELDDKYIDERYAEPTHFICYVCGEKFHVDEVSDQKDICMECANDSII